MTRAALEDGFALGAQFFLVGQVAIFDIGSVPPVYTAVFDQTAAGGGTAPRRGNDIVLRNGAVFVAGNGDVAEFTDHSYYGGGLITGLFQLPVDGGTTPPTVTITSPAAGSSGSDGSPAAGAEVVIDVGYAQLLTTTGGDGSFSVAGIPTLQGGIAVGASLHLPCDVLYASGPTNLAPLNPGGVTAAGVLILRRDSGRGRRRANAC